MNNTDTARSATVNGIVVGYDDIGAGDPILLVHGHPFDRSMWRPQAAALAGAGWRVIVPDLRGYGSSTVVPGKTELSTFARDLAALLDALGVERVVVAGLSMGGQIVMEFQALFPERIRALILADTFAQGETETGKKWRYDLADQLEAEGMDGYARQVLAKMIAPRTIDAHPEVAAHVLGMMTAAPPSGAAAALRGRAERRDYTDLLPAIGVPALVVVGSDDEYTPVSDAEYLRDRIPGARLAVVEGAAHLPNLERPEEFNRIVEDFLAEVEHRPHAGGTLTSIVVDALDVERQERFWTQALSGRTEGLRLRFVATDTPKTGKNRLHLDLGGGPDWAAEVARLLSLGATRTDIGQGDVPWDVLADPEGNEFCVLRPGHPGVGDDRGLVAICLDIADELRAAQSRFWRTHAGWHHVEHHDWGVRLRRTADSAVALVMGPPVAAKTGRNRLRLEVTEPGAAGGEFLDPGGNEYHVIAPSPSPSP